MTDFIPGRVMIDAAQRKRGKYMDKCATIGYGFLPFSFSSLGELEADAVILLKRIRKFSMTRDIGARAGVHIFNRIGSSIAKECETSNIILAFFNFLLQSASLQKMKTDLLSNPSEIAAPNLMKKIYISHVLPKLWNLLFLYLLDRWLCGNLKWRITLLIYGLGQTMNACSKVFTGDIYGDHAISCVGIIGIKHRHNVVHDTLVDACFRSGISATKEVDIGHSGGYDKPLRPVDILLYSWDEGLDVCVDLTGSSPLMQTRMVDFVPGRAEIDATHQKNAVSILKRIRKFSVTQDIGARAAVHIFNKISFAIAKGVWAQLVFWLLTNFL
ncbi:hypothetical protein Tco_0228511 [Tanacetum coccineum]